MESDGVIEALQRIVGNDSVWAGAESTTREDALAALSDAAVVRKVLDRSDTFSRAVLDRTKKKGCGHDAANDAEAGEAAGVSSRENKRHNRRAKVTGQFAAAASALDEGSITGEHLDAVDAVVPDELVDAVVEQQDDLFDKAGSESSDQFRKRLKDTVDKLRAESGEDQHDKLRRQRRASCKRNYKTGMIEFELVTDPVMGSKFEAKLRSEFRRLYFADQQDDHPEREEGRTHPQRWHDAAMNLFLGGSATKTAQADDTLPVVVVERDVLEQPEGINDTDLACEIPGVGPISPNTARRFACSQPVLALSLDKHGKAVAMTSFERHADRNQRRALNALYATCVGPNCTIPFGDCHIHHIEPWSTNPETAFDNLAPLCTRHHHLAHEGGWHLKRKPDNEVAWTRPDGQTHHTRPTPPPRK